ncbi:unnamed protein product (macronuclear) [Paramecium tetraurelia]|uniref:Leucine-rich repeat-containing protein 51 n=1 Tax=Paramecium tetraurelia TaxID=5888 RepID=A0BNY6_PARTE|nr:uncharacterized protein GSPATT00030892001 [Paramecium tetraurelia]CAK60253.1 unnamed protein product [Paramecium tetraurelia]|eukprot:XP_001427651.1 hypothetical protein (macronuclear) [Paramecium tetraurelia strain d4-2]
MTDFFYIQVPADVKVLLLSGTALNRNQLDQVYKCTNLLKLDLSNCNLTLIPNLKKLTNLRILYLHQNQISTLSVEPILGCNHLNYLTLFLNPVSAHCSLRRQVISYMKSLWAFDFNAITDEEKHKELKLKPSTEKSRLPWPVISIPKEQKDQSQIVMLVWQELDVIRKIWQKCSVILTIQRYIKSFITRRKFKNIVLKQMKIQAFIKQAVKHWITFTKNKKDLNQLMAHQYSTQFEKVKVMVQNYRQRKGKAIKEQKSARIIYRSLNSFYKSQKHQLESIGNIHRLYFYKEQLNLFKQILHRLTNKPEIKAIIDQAPLLYEDFQKPNKVYESEVFTYRLPSQINLYNNPIYFKNMLTYPASLSKISCCLQQLKLSIIRKWTQVTKFTQEVHAYSYLQKYDELMPARKPYFIMYKLPKQDKIKYENCLKLINKFQQREYRQLYVINLSKDLLSSVIKCIILHNKDEPSQVFITLFEKQLKEAVAALKIQRQFRAYQDVKKNGKTLQAIINILVKERSLLILQKWIKDLKMHHRNNFYKIIGYRLKQITQNVLYLNYSIYVQLRKCSSKLQFLEQKSNLSLTNYKFQAILQQFPKKNIIPIWLRKQIIQQEEDGQEVFAIIENCDVYHLLHFETQSEIKTLFNQKWMKITFPINDQLKLRLLLLALYTYSFKHQCFVQLYQENELLEQTQIIRQNDELLIKTYQIDQQTQPIDNCDIPCKPSIWLSTYLSDKTTNEVEVRFYKNGIDQKTKKKKNISKLPGCEQISACLFFSTIKKQYNQYSHTQIKQNCPTASTNIRTITQTDKPKTALQTYLFQQDSFEQEPSNVDRQQQRLKLVTNPTRQHLRTKSVMNKKQTMLVELPTFLQSQSFNLSNSGIRQNNQPDLSKQMQYWEDRQNQQRQLIKKQTLEKRQAKLQIQQERSFYQDFNIGQNLISRQGDRHLLRLYQKKQQQISYQQVQQFKEQSNHIKEIQAVNSKMKLQAIKEANSQYKASLEQQPEQQQPKAIQKQSTKRVGITNKYIHSVLPEEIYPIKIEFENI